MKPTNDYRPPAHRGTGVGGRYNVAGTSNSNNNTILSCTSNIRPGKLRHLYRVNTTFRIISSTLFLIFCLVTLMILRNNSVTNHLSSTSIRVFGPSMANDNGINHFITNFNQDENDSIISYQFYTRDEQRNFLLSEHGWTCHEATANHNNQNRQQINSGTNLLVRRFDQLPPQYGTELWKYCVLYTGIGNVYWQPDNLTPLHLIDEILGLQGVSETAYGGKTSNTKTRRSNYESVNIVIQISGLLSDRISNDDEPIADELSKQLHHSFLKLSKPKSKVALGMMRYLLDYDGNNRKMLTPLDTISLQQTLSMYVANDKHKKRNTWVYWTAKCLELRGQKQHKMTGTVSSATTPLVDSPCSADNGEACCQVWTSSSAAASDHIPPSFLIRHANVVDTEKVMASTSNALPYGLQDTDMNDITQEILGMPKSHLPYIATVREFPTNDPPTSTQATPNYFDLLLGNNCLPHDKECFKCLKLGYKEGDDGGDCSLCQDKCPCYCNALCHVRPPPKRVSAEWVVTPPRYRKDPHRLIPRVIHQTWFEPVSPEKYPNMSRLIESFRKSGWEYEFYDDDKTAQFLSTHFPPEVREAYDALIPGAFKADLFRYCVLLIRGGLYADMDILLESNLDEAIPADVGFLTCQDSPGESIGHRSCLWNGLMGVAPAHPVLAQTIQSVVNNIRNRFTSVDYDDMLCPNPVLSVSHTVDMLFTCGPCILGASMNDVLKRHRQTGFDYGEIDLFATEKQQLAGSDGVSHPVNENHLSLVQPDDPRWLVPGKIVVLKQNKQDMGAHRFTAADRNLIIAVTDMPEYDDRPKSIEHYSKSHVKFGVYGLTKLYKNQDKANEEVLIRIEGNPNADTGINRLSSIH